MSNKSDHSSFWDNVQPGQVTTILMDMLTDTLTYVKDTKGRYVHINQAFIKTLGVKKSDIVGKTDIDLFGRELAKHYIADDQSVIISAKPIVEKSELVTYRPGIVKWYLTTKIPLYDMDNKVVGLAGLSRPSSAHQKSELSGPMSSLSKAVEYIYENKHQMISVDIVAAASGLSISTLERGFKKHFNSSPGKFITQVKVSTACELLAEPSYSIAEVCDALGYSDPVVFTRIFKREMKITPSAYRKNLSQYK